MLFCLAAGPADAAFVPGRFVVEGKRLAPSAGKGVSVHLVPSAVVVDGCRTRGARVRRAKGGVRLRARVRCGERTVGLSARVRGRLMLGMSVSGRSARRFRARRARPEGVLLKGKRSRTTLGAVRDVDRLRRHGADEVSRLGRARVARTELVLRVKRGATVGRVNKVLQSLGGGIVGSLERSPALIVAIPDPGSARALKRVVRRVERARMISSVAPSAMAETQALPPGIASPPSARQRAALSHLLASGIAAAWNARAAIRPVGQPTVIVADSFGDGPLSPHVDARQRPRIQRPRRVNGVLLRGRNHGYQVASILFGDFASDGTAAGLVTGVFPARGSLVTIDAIDLTLPGTALRLIDTLDSVPFNVVVNTSLGRNGGQIDNEMFPEAADWIRNVRNNQLEQRVLHATSAGNDASSARFNGLWAAAALRDDIRDDLTGGRVGPLSNTLAVENVGERSDASELACLFPNSNFAGNIAAPGQDIYSLDRDGRVAPVRERDGTSLASPVVAGLATYLWSIAPDLTPQQLKAAMVENAQPVTASEQNCVSAPRIDAYKALLSLDQPGAPSLTGYPVRLALLDVNGDRSFTQTDLEAWAPKINPDGAATTRDWSRHDLNGDGFTGGTRTKAFDLDRASGSQRAGTTTLGPSTPFPATGRTLDENAVTDADILCYYAYSALYTGNTERRRELLDPLDGCKANDRIVFHSNRDGNNEIYLMNADGSGQQRRTTQPEADFGPSWSPDGQRIAFTSFRDGNAEIYVMNADGTGAPLNRTNNSATDQQPTWSPDGQRIAFVRDADIFVMNADGTGVPLNITNNPATDVQPTWSPDGQRIAFASSRDSAALRPEVYVVNADGTGSPQNLTNSPGEDNQPAWSPDGQQIAFRSGREPGNPEIYVMNVDGTGVPLNRTNHPGADQQPTWSPDGQQIAFTSFRDGNFEIYRINADGTGPQQNLTNNPGEDDEPDW